MLQPASFFVLRVPLLPLETLTRWSGGSQTAEQSDHDSGRVDVLRDRLWSLTTTPGFCEALRLASPDLYAVFQQEIDKPLAVRDRAIEQALAKYLSRMSSRCTPFGLFAGHAVGRIGRQTTIALGSPEQHRRIVQPDTAVLYALARRIQRTLHKDSNTEFIVNTSAYKCGSGYRYFETRVDNDGKRTFELTVCEGTPYLDLIVDAAKQGASRHALECILAQFNASAKEAEEYIDELIESQLLVASLDVRLTDPNPFATLLAAISASAPSADPTREAGVKATRALADLSATPIGTETCAYELAKDALRELAPHVPESRMLHAQCQLTVRDATLGERMAGDVSRGIQLLYEAQVPDATDGFDQHVTALDAFRLAFTERFGDAEVPLGIALDPELGIDLDKEMAYPVEGNEPAVTRRVRHEWAERLLHLAGPAIRQRAASWCIDSASRELLKVRYPRSLPPSLVAWTRIERSHDPMHDPTVFIRTVTSPSIAPFTRFATSDPLLESFIRDEARWLASAADGAVDAEVIHVPADNHANVITRPQLSDYEIPYLGSGGASPRRVIRIDDLTVSVRDNRIVLRSATLQRVVRPCSTSAHAALNTSRLPIYRFLAACGYEHTSPQFQWSWHVYNQLPYLPRVVMDGVVLALARWRLFRADIEHLCRKTIKDRFAHMCDLRARLALPRWIVLSNDDVELLVDLDNEISVDAFIAAIRRALAVTITEAFPSPERGSIRGEDGLYAAELLIPYRNTETRAASTITRADAYRPAMSHIFMPGSEWAYLKLYTGFKQIDHLLRTELYPLLRRFEEEGAISQWFFVRYLDPRPHLRLRLRGEASNLWRRVNAELQPIVARLAADHLVYKMSYDPYVREVARYGGAGCIEYCERIFHADSIAVCEALTTIGHLSPSADDTRMLVAFSVHTLIDASGLTLNSRIELLNTILASYDRGSNREVLKKRKDIVSRHFRRAASECHRLFNAVAMHAPWETLSSICRRRRESIEPLLVLLSEACTQGQASVTLSDLLASLIHMHVNRMLSSVSREDELRVYEFLQRHYLRTRAVSNGRPVEDAV